MIVFWLALLGLVEFILRIILIVVLVCTIVGLLLFLDEDLEDFVTPYLWKLLDAHIRNR